MSKELENTMVSQEISEQFSNFPGTRYMGSKQKIAIQIVNALNNYHFDSVIDLFGGSNVIGYLFKCCGKKVVSNDFMSFSYHLAKAIIENDSVTLGEETVETLMNTKNDQTFIRETFDGLYFNESENHSLDQIRGNIDKLKCDYEKSIAISALVRACIKKRPRGIFTYTGQRYNDGRKDLKKSLVDHFIESVALINNAVFSNGHSCLALNDSALHVKSSSDLIYIDPPYFTPNSDNDYVRRYHFVEGLARNWMNIEIQENTKTKKFKSYPSPFATRKGAYESFLKLIEANKKSIIAISYSSNSIPTKEDLGQMLIDAGKQLEVIEIDHTYSFGNQNHKIGNKNNRVKEYLFIGK